MKVRSVKQVCFSPTGTTKAIVQAIARGIDSGENETIDLTAPDGRKQEIRAGKDDLLIVGIPVYIGRVPALLTDCLRAIKADNTPTVCVVVFGNRAFDDALVELEDIMIQCGCRPIAAGAYIGEHSFSSAERPASVGRPDAGDLRHAESFGRRIREKVEAVPSVDGIPAIDVPGVRPYRGDAKLWDVDFIAVNDDCTQCGICAGKCPVAAIDPEDSRAIDTVKCLTCCACIKACPQGARSMKPSPVMDASVRVHTLFAERKEPQCFL